MSNAWNERLLNATAVFAWLAVGVLGLSTLAGRARGGAAALWLLFGLGLLWGLKHGFPRPGLYFAVQTALVTLLMAQSPTWSPFPILFFLLSAQAVLLYPLRGAVAWALGFTGLTLAALAWQAGWAAALVATPAYAAGYLFFLAFGHALHQAQQARAEAQRLLRELRAAHEQLRAYAAQSAALAVAEERNRLAQEMHDTLGHHLTAAAVQLEAAAALVARDPDRAAHLVATVREQIRQSLSELRRTVAALRPALDDLPAALTTLAQRFAAATGLRVAVDCRARLDDLTPAARLLLYRAAQEGLTNIQRHAQARHAWLRVTRTADALRLTLDDDGVGPRADRATPTGLGLQGMDAQARRLGGYARLHPRDAGGARLEVYIPLDAATTPRAQPPGGPYADHPDRG